MKKNGYYWPAVVLGAITVAVLPTDELNKKTNSKKLPERINNISAKKENTNKDSSAKQDVDNTASSLHAFEPKIIIRGGELGEYGCIETFNAGTESEYIHVIYRIPPGTYIVTNHGEYTSQFNIYNDEIVKTELGCEEHAGTGFAKLLDSGESTEFTINENQHIYIGTDGIWYISEKQS